DAKTVKDLMLSIEDYATVSEHSTIRDALAALSKSQLGLTYDRHHHRAVLVLDKEGRVIGKLTHWAILRSLQPKAFNDEDYEALSRSGLSQDFIQSVGRLVPFHGSLTRMCQRATQVKVRDAMVPARESIDEQAPLVEAINQMVLLHMQSMLVTRDGRVVGILRMSDVFEEIADMIRDGCNRSGESG
ncbi:MAG: CBS domain-containing protein, partial [Polyangiaceae bacterium]|nr:CBS domain-containing protein [Polyangiaceae bacterium]